MSFEQGIYAPTRSKLVAIQARGTSMSPLDRKRRGVLEFRDLVERVRLPMTRIACRRVTSLMVIFVTTCASLVEPQETLLTVRRQVGVGKRMTVFASKVQVYSLQAIIEPRMIETARIGNPRQGKTLLVDHLKFSAMMLGMTPRAVFG